MLQSTQTSVAPSAAPVPTCGQGKAHSRSSIFGAIAIFLLALSNNPAHAADTVRIGVGIDPSFTTWWVAKDRGFFQKHNINAEITQFSGTPDMADATMAGEMDFGSSGTATYMPRFVRSDALLIVGTLANSTDNFKIAALTTIKSLPELKGKRVGTVASSTTDYLWALLLKKLNISDSEIILFRLRRRSSRSRSIDATSWHFSVGSPGLRRRSRFPARTKSKLSGAAVTQATSRTLSSRETGNSFRQILTRPCGCSPRYVKPATTWRANVPRPSKLPRSETS